MTDGHQLLIDPLDSHRVIMDENWQRDQKLAQVKSLLYNSGTIPEIRKLETEQVAPRLQRVRWGMHPLGQKLVDAL
jgi:hypothetical protein